MYYLKYYCAVALLLITAIGFAQNKSNKGKEFWLGYGHNVLFTQEAPGNTQTQVLYLSAEQAATVTVSIPGNGWSQTVNIAANTVDASVILPKAGATDARLTGEGLFNRGIHVQSNVPIVAYTHQHGLVSSAATMLMPVETFGYTYYSLNYKQVSNYPDSYSWFYIVAAEDNTKIEVTPADTTANGWLNNQTYTIALNKGQIYNVFGKLTGTFTGKDMTGSKIVSVAGADGNCHPIAVFSGSSRNVICDGNGGEVMQQQIFPANAWGTRYVTFHNVNGINNPTFTPFLNHYRVLVSNPSTIVKRNGNPLTSLINNCYYEFSSNSGDDIEANQPILVAQYTVNSNECVNSNSNVLGDPEMIYLSPIEQGVTSAYFYTTRNQAIDYNFINVIIPTTAIGTVKIDGSLLTAADYILHPNNSNYTVAVKRLLGPAAQHSITADSTFIATAYGVGTFESYGYNVGTFVNNLNAYSEIKNTLNTTGTTDSFTCPKTPLRLFVKLAYRATKLEWKLSQATNGVSPSADVTVSQPIPIDSAMINGRMYFTYTLPQDISVNSVGGYSIPVTYSAPDIDACNQTETTTIHIVAKPSPRADFTYAGTSCVNDSLQLTGIVNATGFSIQEYRWDFADNSTASTINTTKEFISVGSQTIRFRAYVTNGCVADTTKTIGINPLPIALFSMADSSCTNTNVAITDSSFIANGTIASWQWQFGDGATVISTNNSPTQHNYTTSGNYTVALQTTSSHGCKSDTCFRTITILPQPLANFGFVGKLCIGNAIQFIDSSIATSGNIKNWQWQFGDGQSDSLTSNASILHSYQSAGTFNVSLVVQTQNGCSALPFTQSIQIHPTPTINAGADKIIYTGSSIVLDATIANPNLYDFSWSPATFLSNAVTLNPTATPLSTITYQITAIDRTHLCTAADEVFVKVVNKLVVPNAFSPNGDGINDTWKISGLEAYPTATVTIFTRTGQKIFESNNYNNKPWNGNRNNNPLPIGSYAYIIYLNNTFKEQLSGTVLLLR